MSGLPFTRLVGCRAPVQLAPMPGIATVELAAAVSNAGGLGMIGAAMYAAPELAQALGALGRATSAPFGATFLMPFLDPACLEIAASRARVVDFFYDEPDPALVARVHAGGALAGWQVGSREEALRAADAGCDLVVAQGNEAGGHVRGKLGLLPLLDSLRGALRLPIVAAGGIATGRQAAAALAAGASAVRMGTRFACAAESGAHARYVAALLAARAEDSVLTEAFSVLWPDAPHRVLRSCIDAARASTDEVVGEIDWYGRRLPVPRLSVYAPTRETSGAIEAMALYAGRSVGDVDRVQPAAEIVAEIAAAAAAVR
jgi:NAD(P)H-dependent flavin oxidoreductase YrpB (nitropropane dioxygenase family)